MSTFDRLKTVIADELEVSEDEVTENASFTDDLGADSLDLVELVMRLEEEFEVEIPDEDAEKIRTVKDALTYIEEKSKANEEIERLHANEPGGDKFFATRGGKPPAPKTR